MAISSTFGGPLHQTRYLPNPVTYNEPELVLRIAEGDEAAFRVLFHFYADALSGPLIKITRSPESADDVIQETFMRVWLYRDKLPEISHLRNWIFRIAYSRAFNHLRDLKIHESAIGRILMQQPEEGATVDAPEGFDMARLHSLIKKAVLQLPPRQREIYELSREQHLTLREIADKLSLSVQTVKNTIGLALKAIREFLEKAGYQSFLLFFYFFF